MAHKKGEGSTQNGRDSNPKFLGVKLFGGQTAKAGSIILRQRGSKYHLGDNVYMGKDWTIHAKVPGTVKYTKGRRRRTFVHIVPFGEVEERLDVKPTPKKEETVKVPLAKTVKAAPEPPKAEKKAATPPAPKKATGKKDDLRKIEGIGPKIASLLNEAGILTFAELASTEAAKIKEILVAAGSRFSFHDPTTWPEQAKMAAEGRWDDLKKWQDASQGGKPIEAKAKKEAKAEEE
ncbi:MAG TPA: 50S ribosomal protein L27 [Bacteroidetes bacterium]|nr:50S ribosomal protein L27 [Bacteroidota bacterium]